MLLRNHHFRRNGKHIGVHIIHFFQCNFKYIFFTKNIYNQVIISWVQKTILVNQCFPIAYRHKSAIEMQRTQSRIRIMFNEFKRNKCFVRENFLQEIKSIAIGSSGFQLRIIGSGIKSHKHNIVVKHHIATFDMRFFGQIEYFVVRNLIVHNFVSLFFVLAVGNNIRVYNFIVDHYGHIARKHLIAIFKCPGAKYLHIVFQQHFLERRHFLVNRFLGRINSPQNGFVRFSIVCLTGSLARSLRNTLRTTYHNATHDTLTGLHNRRSFDDFLAAEISRQKRFGEQFSLLLLDLDRFKELNDTRGHAAGDDALRLTAEALRRGTRESDTVARLGGDEFIALLPNASQADCATIGAHVAQRIAEAMTTAGYTITASIGTKTFNTQPDSAEKALELADQALYAAKAGGRNRCVNR